jgi:hypothetical protein
MTTNNNEFKTRIVRDNGEALEFTVGIPVDGFADPTGEYPVRYNFFQSSISAAGRGTKINDLWIGGSTLGANFDIPFQSPSLFPFNQANETPSGHSFELDDTPGAERVLVKHRTGAGVELKPDGSVIVASRSNRIEVVGADHEVIVQGEGNITYDGDLNLTVNGNYNVKVGGTMNVDIGANHNHSIHGTYTTETGGAHSTIVRGNLDTKVYGDTIDFSSGEKKIVAKKDLRLLSGKDILINSKRDVRSSAEKKYTVASGQLLTLTSEDTHVTGSRGKIGGENFHHFGSLFTGPENDQGTNTVFHGNLVGRALEAWTSKYAKFAENSHGAYRSQYSTYSGTASIAFEAASIDADANVTNPLLAGTSSPMNTLPNYQFDWGWTAKDNTVIEQQIGRMGSPISPYYGNPENWVEVWNKVSPYAVRKVYVDEDNEIENKISKRDTYFGYFNWAPDTYEIRSKLRTMEGANDASTSPEGQTNAVECISSLLKENRISSVWSIPIPTETYSIKRTSGSYPRARFGYTLLGNPVERASKSFTPSRESRAQLQSGQTILTDPIYNPDRQSSPITSRTKLSKSCTISKFLGAPGSRSSLEYIPDFTERQDLARQWYLHAWLMEGISSCKQFSNYRLQVTEGYYNPAGGIREKYQPSQNPSNRYWREPYRKEDGGDTQRSILIGSTPINQLKYEGRAVVYTLYNSRGKVDYSATYDLALYIRDTFYFDQLSLDYDMVRPDLVMSQQLIVVMPKIDNTFKCSFQQRVCTYFNRKLLSKEDLIEITD